MHVIHCAVGLNAASVVPHVTQFVQAGITGDRLLGITFRELEQLGVSEWLCSRFVALLLLHCVSVCYIVCAIATVCVLHCECMLHCVTCCSVCAL